MTASDRHHSYTTAINYLRDRDRLLREGKPFPSDETFLKMLADVLPAGPSGGAIAWIVTGKNGSVLHFAKADGWSVEIAQTQPTTPSGGNW